MVTTMALGAALASPVAVAQEVGANTVIPVPVPRTETIHWVDRPGRERVELDANGVKLRGWRYKVLSEPSHSETPVVVFFNGNMMTVERSEELYRQLAELGMEVVVYDYRGYGFSQGRPDVMAFRRDALRIYDHTVEENPGRRVMVYGFSLGTAMAAYVASERRVAAVVLAAPFATAEREMPVFARRMGFSSEAIRRMAPAEDARVAFDEVGMMRRSEAPLLVLSGTEDTLVPMEQGREVLAASAAKEKRFVELRGAQHYETVFVEKALVAVRTFLSVLG